MKTINAAKFKAYEPQKRLQPSLLAACKTLASSARYVRGRRDPSCRRRRAMEAAPELPLVVRGSLQRACLASLSAGALKRCPTQREPGSVLKASSQDQERHANGYLRPPRARGGGRRRHRARCGEDAAAVVRRRPPRRWNISGRQRAVDPRARPVDLSTDLERPRGIRHPQALVHGGPPVFTGEWSGAERAAPVAARGALYCVELLCCRGKCWAVEGRGQGDRRGRG